MWRNVTPTKEIDAIQKLDLALPFVDGGAGGGSIDVVAYPTLYSTYSKHTGNVRRMEQIFSQFLQFFD